MKIKDFWNREDGVGEVTLSGLSIIIVGGTGLLIPLEDVQRFGVGLMVVGVIGLLSAATSVPWFPRKRHAD